MAVKQYSPAQLTGWAAKMSATLNGVAPSGKEFKAQCPAHPDAVASLTWGIHTGSPKFHCHAGCSGTKVGNALRALGLWGEVAAYPYTNPAGTLLYEAVRFEPKEFKQRHPGGWGRGGAPYVLYRLPGLLAADPREPVFIVEGEKDADRLWAEGLVATTNVGGAGKWRAEYSLALAGRTVVVLPDNDNAGAQHGAAVASAVGRAAASVKVLALPNLPPKGDVSDWLNAGGTAAQLKQLAAAPAAAPAPLVQQPTQKAVPVAAAAAPPPTPPAPKQPKGGKATAIKTALASMGYDFRYNLLKQRLECRNGTVTYHPIHDGELAKLVVTLYDAGMEHKQLILDAIEDEAYEHRYDPLQEWLNGLAWDGRDWIGALAGHFTDAHPPIQYDCGCTRSVTEAWLRFFLPGAVARILWPGVVQLPMLVLIGPQDLGKSEFVGWLGRAAPGGYYIEGSIAPTQVECQRDATGNFLWEVAELGATIRHADVEALKGFLTRMEHTYRMPYAHSAVTLPALASFVGTLNEEQTGFLADATGDRRFLCVEWTAARWEYQRAIDVQQVWAQAVALARAKASAPDGPRALGRLSPEEQQVRAGVNETHHAEDPTLEAILRHYDVVTPGTAPLPGWSNFVPTYEVVRRIQGEVKETTTRGLQMAIARAMTRLGIKKVKNNTTAVGTNGYVGIRIKPGHELPELAFGEG